MCIRDSLALVFVFVTRFIASARNAGGLLLRAFDIIRMHAVAAKFLGEGVLERDAAGLMIVTLLGQLFRILDVYKRQRPAVALA